jgi:hypothetical protein
MKENRIVTGTSDGIKGETRGAFWKIFFEPAKCFEGLNAKPAFIFPMLLCVLIAFGSSFVIYSKVDMAQAMRKQIESSSAAAQLSEEQITEQVRMATKFGKISALVAPLVVVPLSILLIAGLMLLGIYLIGSETTFSRVLAVAASSMFFYSVVGGILTITVFMAASDPNAINLRNPVFTNPAGLLDPEENRVLYAFLTHLDILVWYTIYLLGLGLSIVATKCSVAKGIVLIGIWYVLYALAHTGLASIF